MGAFDAQRVDELLDALGSHLAAEDTAVELVVCGGAGLLALGLIERGTVDVDVVAVHEDGQVKSAHPLPAPVIRARDLVARDFRLPPDWLDDRPTVMLDFGLPEGFESRLIRLVYGGLTVHFLGRLDQIHLKLYALADQHRGSKHDQDLAALAPTHEELLTAAAWTRTHDPSEGFLSVLRAALAHLGVDGSGVE